jgi:hypothetical protein
MDDVVDKIYKAKIVSAKQNAANMAKVKANWNLGPEKTSPDMVSNKPYWSKMAKVWDIPERDARHQMCANCEYFDNTPETMQLMDAIPLTSFDMDGGGRGYCTKFDFICHNLRTCQAWERKDFIGD